MTVGPAVRPTRTASSQPSSRRATAGSARAARPSRATARGRSPARSTPGRRRGVRTAVELARTHRAADRPVSRDRGGVRSARWPVNASDARPLWRRHRPRYARHRCATPARQATRRPRALAGGPAATGARLHGPGAACADSSPATTAARAPPADARGEAGRAPHHGRYRPLACAPACASSPASSPPGASTWATTSARSRSTSPARTAARRSTASSTCTRSRSPTTRPSCASGSTTRRRSCSPRASIPTRCILFRQGDVDGAHRAVLAAVRASPPYGDLNRMHQFKEKSAAQRELVSAGLLPLPGAPGRRRARLPRPRGAGRRRPAPAHRAHARHRRALQRALRRRRSSCPSTASPRSARGSWTCRSPTRKMSTTGGSRAGHGLRARRARGDRARRSSAR